MHFVFSVEFIYTSPWVRSQQGNILVFLEYSLPNGKILGCTAFPTDRKNLKIRENVNIFIRPPKPISNI